MIRWLPVAHVLTACAPAAMALLFLRAGLDAFTTVKATAAVLAAVVLVWALAVQPSVAVAWRAVRPPPVFGVAVGALVATGIVAALAAPSPLRAVVGEPGRHSGAGVWTAALLLSVGAAAASRVDGGRLLVRATVAACLPVAAYALVQAAGADPLMWEPVEGGPQVFATLGNADYLSAWLGMALPVALAAVVDAGQPPGWRLAAAGAMALGWVAALLTGSFQGPVAGMVGSLVVLAATVAVPGWRRRRLAGWGLLVLFVAAVGVGLVAVVGSPAAVRASAERSFQTRLPLWRAALVLAGEQPLTGVGQGHFGDHWFRVRPLEVVPATADEVTPGAALGRPVDDAHAVVLHVAATAGWPAALLWLGTQVGVLAVGARTTRTSGAEVRTSLAGLCGATAAALVVQVVSVQVAPLTVTGWVFVGATAGVATRWGAAPRGRGPESAAAGTSDAQRPDHRVAVTVATVAALAVGVLACLPLAADLVAGRAAAAEVAERPDLADRRWRLASRLAPWERRYPARHAESLAVRGRFAAALAAQSEALARAPWDRAAAVDRARLVAAVRGPAAAVPSYEHAVDIDPFTPALLVEAGANALQAGDADRALALLRRALTTAPEDERVAELLRQAAENAGS